MDRLARLSLWKSSTPPLTFMAKMICKEMLNPMPRNNRLRQERLQRNWRQADLAEQLGTTALTVRRWETGTQQISAYYRVKLCALFGKSAEELGFGPESPQPAAPVEVEAAVSGLWGVPYPRNPFFAGRAEILWVLHERISRARCLALTQSWTVSGLGGIGKTQTVLEYTYRHLYDYRAIFWVSAETAETILASFAALADLLDLPEKEEREQGKVAAAVLRWLSSHEGWLLIFDNVEEPELVKGYVPASHQGALLFTSRRRALGLSAQAVDLDTMTLEEGTRFLLHRAGILASTAAMDQLEPGELEAARTIVAAMDGLPLALDQAGAHIEATQCSLSTYLRLLQAAPQRLLAEREAHADHPLSVSQTFTLIFEQIKQYHPSAVELLTACAFLAPDAIPEELFLEGAALLGPAFETLAADPFQFQATLKTLLSYSLLQHHAATRTLAIHRLVQVVLLQSMTEEERNQWSRLVIEALNAVFPSSALIESMLPGGKLIFHLMGALAEFERDLIRERTNAGLAAARARGRIGGRPKKLTTNGKVALARWLFADPNHSISEICSTLEISHSTLYRYVREMKQKPSEP
jgi:transcriptional regulator with XRE-family HTH domain